LRGNRAYKHKLDNRGQSTVEFALTMIFALSFILFFVQLSLVFGFANYVHYATFMAARAYQAAGQSQADQQARAQAVLTRMLKRGGSTVDRFPAFGRGFGGGDIRGAEIGCVGQCAGDPGFSWMTGVRYTFRSKLFMIPMPGSPGAASSINSLTLTSESWLTREPTYTECQAVMGKMEGIFDNGC